MADDKRDAHRHRFRRVAVWCTLPVHGLVLKDVFAQYGDSQPILAVSVSVVWVVGLVWAICWAHLQREAPGVRQAGIDL